jgi:hypothetical protein
VGRCNREIKCGYHYPPAQYFRDHPDQRAAGRAAPVVRPDNDAKSSAPDRISQALMKKSLTGYDRNHFVLWLRRQLGKRKTNLLVKRFRVGTSHYWRGSVVFWQIDNRNQVRTGKIMLYNPVTGRRMKDQNGQSRINWVHAVLKSKHRMTNFRLQQCFFGLHQLITAPSDQPVAIVEGEKTAIIASAREPGFVWLAAGSLNGLNPDKFFPLTGRHVVLFPDLGEDTEKKTPWQKWHRQASQIRKNMAMSISVSDILEVHATADDRQHGYDLADFLLEKRIELSSFPIK